MTEQTWHVFTSPAARLWLEAFKVLFRYLPAVLSHFNCCFRFILGWKFLCFLRLRRRHTSIFLRFSGIRTDSSQSMISIALPVLKHISAACVSFSPSLSESFDSFIDLVVSMKIARLEILDTTVVAANEITELGFSPAVTFSKFLFSTSGDNLEEDEASEESLWVLMAFDACSADGERKLYFRLFDLSHLTYPARTFPTRSFRLSSSLRHANTLLTPRRRMYSVPSCDVINASLKCFATSIALSLWMHFEDSMFSCTFSIFVSTLICALTREIYNVEIEYRR